METSLRISWDYNNYTVAIMTSHLSLKDALSVLEKVKLMATRANNSSTTESQHFVGVCFHSTPLRIVYDELVVKQ